MLVEGSTEEFIARLTKNPGVSWNSEPGGVEDAGICASLSARQTDRGGVCQPTDFSDLFGGDFVFRMAGPSGPVSPVHLTCFESTSSHACGG
jgi:hypothetical protein